VLAAEDVLEIVLELLTTYCTDHVISTRSRFFDALGMLLFLGLLPLHVFDVLIILLV